MFKAASIALLALPLTIFSQIGSAEQTDKHLYAAAKADPALSAEFERVMMPFSSNSPWVKSFGTTAPATTETVDGQTYDVYWGCKPHDCITESYVVMYKQSTKKITAGAFLQNSYDGPNLTKSRITWMEKTDTDSARALGKYLY
ncbi:Ivy family c-type lysozyme inhibitor [Pollutimonas harenae]|uniref:C-lysozyme inhibitor n=1 Tax=Pollutimonas harenae TaxID=657015 RepID=A0A853GU71_9BURK|nr:Ivy family c-type lysozyme inhibitor [Pollutimonas harenae]NYT85811.1 hypothetical protein [Pollutimonas harenae]TEA70871.1 hypothetical protein ERD84_09440 [Pollutimonas harenae]